MTPDVNMLVGATALTIPIMLWRAHVLTMPPLPLPQAAR